MKQYFLGEACICWELGKEISPATSKMVLRLYRNLKRRHEAGSFDVLDIVPSYTALAVHFDPLAVDIGGIEKTVRDALDRTRQRTNEEAFPGGTTVILPVRYDGPDIGRVASHTRIPVEEVIRLHAASVYTVAMIGFLPHFPYLLGLPEGLATPRLDSPRTRVPAGSVAIGGMQTGVYPRESPGGWNIIGTTDPALLIPLEPGDTVVFTPEETCESC